MKQKWHLRLPHHFPTNLCFTLAYAPSGDCFGGHDTHCHQVSSFLFPFHGKRLFVPVFKSNLPSGLTSSIVTPKASTQMPRHVISCHEIRGPWLRTRFPLHSNTSFFFILLLFFRYCCQVYMYVKRSCVSVKRVSNKNGRGSEGRKGLNSFFSKFEIIFFHCIYCAAVSCICEVPPPPLLWLSSMS